MRYDICAAHRVRCQAVGDAMVRAISVSVPWTGTGDGAGAGAGAGAVAG